MNRLFIWNKAAIKRRSILLLIIILFGVGWYYLVKFRPWDIRIPVINANKQLPDYEFQDIVIREVAGAKMLYRVSANAFTMDRTQGLLQQVSGSILEKEKPLIDFTADDGILNVQNKSFTFNNFAGQTAGRSAEFWQITSQVAYWDNNMQNFTFDKRPRLFSRDMVITATKITYNMPFNFFTIGSECEVRRGEYTVKSDKAVLKNAIDVLTLENNVEMSGKDFVTRADLVDWDIRRDEMIFKNNVILQTEDIILTGVLVSLNTTQDTVVLKNDVRLKTTQGDIVVNTDRALWDRKAQKIMFYENTRAWRNESLIETDQISYDFAKKDLLAEGSGRTKIIKADE